MDSPRSGYFREDRWDHVSDIHEKLYIHDRAWAVLYTIKQGLVDPDRVEEK